MHGQHKDGMGGDAHPVPYSAIHIQLDPSNEVGQTRKPGKSSATQGSIGMMCGASGTMSPVREDLTVLPCSLDTHAGS